TAILHVGHGLNNVIQDVLIRFERMRGRAAEWLPGTDHAGIATQNVVERLLAEEGKTRFDLGREKFVERTWAFVRQTGNAILEQLKVIGCSCDWSRTRFTFDAAYSRSVREVFVRLWEEGLIYRGHRVIHWCPHCLTSLSDEEAEFAEETGTLYYIRYPVKGGGRPVGGHGAGAGGRGARIGGAQRARSLRRPQEDRANDAGPRPAREGGAAPARRAPLLPLRHGGRAPALRPMVRQDEAPGRARAAGIPDGGGAPRPRAVGRDLRALDGAHPRLEHLAAAGVGAA